MRGSVRHPEKMGEYTCVGAFAKRPLYRKKDDFLYFSPKLKVWYIGSMVGMEERKSMFNEELGREVSWKETLFLKLEQSGESNLHTQTPVDTGRPESRSSSWKELFTGCGHALMPTEHGDKFVCPSCGSHCYWPKEGSPAISCQREC